MVVLGEPQQSANHSTCGGQSGGGVGVDIGEPKQYHHHPACGGQSGDGVEVDNREPEQSDDLRNYPNPLP